MKKRLFLAWIGCAAVAGCRSLPGTADFDHEIRVGKNRDVRTLSEARDAVRVLKTSDKVKPGGRVGVLFDDGVYSLLDGGVAFDDSDSSENAFNKLVYAPMRISCRIQSTRESGINDR